MISHSRILAAVLVLIGLIAPQPLQAAPQTVCFAPAEARKLALEAKLLRLSVLKSRVEKALHGEIVHARLCRIDENPVYALTVLRAGGQVERVLANALTGTILDGSWPAEFSGALPADVRGRAIAK